MGNTFGATALSSYGGFWIAVAIIFTPGGFDIAAWLGPLGILALVVTRKVAAGPLFPVKDPRLAETKKVENL